MCNSWNSWQKLFFALCLCVSAVSLSCSSKPTDLRALIPADSLVYLESNDLGEVMKAITDRPAFREAAKTVPDFSALNGVKLAVAVTGFETKEHPVTDENSVLSFQPRFVAILDTNAWNFQALAFAENKLGEFISHIYGGEVLLETSDKPDGKYFVWTANDGRKAYALVQGNLVYFGNDETAIEKSLAVKRRETDSIAKNPKVTTGDRLAFGYVSPDGVAQLANVLGVKYASEASDEPEVQSAIAGILPQLLRNTITDITWTAVNSQEGMEDHYNVGIPSEAASVLAETMVGKKEPNTDLFRLTPESLASVTRYNFQDARIAWRSVLLVADRALGGSQGPILEAFAASLFESYGIDSPELFLSTVDSTLHTFDLGTSDDSVGVAARIRDEANLKRSISDEIDFSKKPEIVTNTEVWRSSDKQLAAAILGHVTVGSGDVIDQSLLAENDGKQLAFTDKARIGASSAPIVTLGKNIDNENRTVETLAEVKVGTQPLRTDYLTETRFNQKGIERRTVSDFGFIGWLITQFAGD